MCWILNFFFPLSVLNPPSKFYFVRLEPGRLYFSIAKRVPVRFANQEHMSYTGQWEDGEQTCSSPCFFCSGQFQFPAFTHIHMASFTEPPEKPHTPSSGLSIKDIPPLQRMSLMPHLPGAALSPQESLSLSTPTGQPLSF